MEANKLHTFKILGYDATLLDSKVEVSVPNYEVSTKIVLLFTNIILDRKIKSLRINLPNKIIFISAQDKDNLLMRAEDCNSKVLMN
jgi:hypothetical protein